MNMRAAMERDELRRQEVEHKAADRAARLARTSVPVAEAEARDAAIKAQREAAVEQQAKDEEAERLQKLRSDLQAVAARYGSLI
jgi:hypothetical protein